MSRSGAGSGIGGGTDLRPPGTGAAVGAARRASAGGECAATACATTAGRRGNSGPSPWASACCSARCSLSARSSCGWAYVIWMLVSRGADGLRETTAGGEGDGRVRLSALRSPLGNPSLGRLLAPGIAGHMKACSSRERSRGSIPLAVPAVRGTTRSERPSAAAAAQGRLRVIGATAAAACGGSARACRLYGATAPPSCRTMVPDIVLVERVCM